MARPEFHKIDSIEPVVGYLATAITSRLLREQRVLWLVTGGSGIKVVVAVSKQLVTKDVTNLTVALTDERYGPPGHPDSNWQQIIDAGFALPPSQLQPVLAGQNMQTTAKAYAKQLETNLAKADYSIALVGIGGDGHVFGIKQGSPAVDKTKLVVAYGWNDYARVTPTPKFIKQLDKVVVYAVGPEKKIQLEQLQKDLPVNEQPAQALKQAAKLIVFTDQKGG